MSSNYDFKKELEKTKVQLAKLSQEAVKIAKKGEKEIVEFSRNSKLHLDSTSITLKKEQLYYLIGKEYVSAKAPEKPTPKLKKLLGDFKKANKEQLALKRKLKTPKKIT